MMRRRPMRRGPGLVGMAARTAVVAGTATAVAGHVHEKQYEKQEAAAQAQSAQAAPPPPDPAPAPPAAAPAPAGGEESLIDQIERLGQLHAQGLLTDDEFASMKAKLLA